jgi:uncharacterized protein (TIGR02147 family)
MPNVFAYTNYRKYLEDFYEEKKKTTSSYSYRGFSKYAGFSSPNFTRMVVRGARNLADTGIVKLVKYLKLNKTEASFFKSLVYFNQSDKHEDRKKYFEKICYFKAFQEIKNIDHKNYIYFSKWYYPTIREMILLKSFKEDPTWIARNLSPSITSGEVKEAIKLLRDIGFLQKDKSNRLKPVEKNISSEPEVTSISLWNFHQEMIRQANYALENTPGKFRDISSVTVAIDQKKFATIQKKLDELRREIIIDTSDAKNSDTVYQLNFQLFNLTKIPKSWK